MLLGDLLEELQEKLRTGEFSIHDHVNVRGEDLAREAVSSMDKVSGDTIAFAVECRLCDQSFCTNDDEFAVDDEVDELEETIEELQERIQDLRTAIKLALKTPDARCTILEEALKEDGEESDPSEKSDRSDQRN